MNINKKARFIITIIVLSCFLLNICILKSFAGMADYDDATADAEAKNEEQEQVNENVNTIKSSNNYLKNLSIEGIEINPEFDKQTINYTVENETSKNIIEITAEAESDKATVSGKGSVTLVSGKNTLNIDVTAENGAVRTYSIIINKKEKIDAVKLTGLELKTNDNNVIDLTPEFSEKTYTYLTKVESNIDKINVNYTANENTSVSIEGQDNLKEGENTIVITVKSLIDNENETVYKIEVNRKKSTTINNNTVNVDRKIIVIAISAILIVLLISLIIHRVKIKRKH